VKTAFFVQPALAGLVSMQAGWSRLRTFDGISTPPPEGGGKNWPAEAGRRQPARFAGRSRSQTPV